MLRLFQKTVARCNSCPNCGDDINITRFECRAMQDKFICWGTSEDVPIPPWCPLPETTIPTA